MTLAWWEQHTYRQHIQVINISRNNTVVALHCKLSLAQTCSQQRLPFKKKQTNLFCHMSARAICCVCPIQESLSSADTPHKQDIQLTYNTWLEDNMSTASTSSRESSPGERNKPYKIVSLTPLTYLEKLNIFVVSLCSSVALSIVYLLNKCSYVSSRENRWWKEPGAEPNRHPH